MKPVYQVYSIGCTGRTLPELIRCAYIKALLGALKLLPSLSVTMQESCRADSALESKQTQNFIALPLGTSHCTAGGNDGCIEAYISPDL